MKKFLRFAGDFVRAFPQLLLFELLYKLFITAVGAPALALLIRLVMKYAGVSYLSAESIPEFIKSPVTWFAVILTLFLVAFFSVVELSALIAGFAGRCQRRKITVYGMLREGLHTFANAFHGTGIFSFIGFMLLIPLAQVTVTSGIFFAPLMPALRMLFSSQNRLIYIAAFVFIQLGIFYLFSSRIYCLHYLVLTNHPFSECTARSRKCIAGKKLRTALIILLWSLLMVLAAAVVTFGVSFVVIFMIKGFSAPTAAMRSALKVLSYAMQIFYIISAVISAPVLICCLSTKFFSETENTEKIIFPEQKSPEKMPKPLKAVTAFGIAAVCFFLNFSYIREIYRGNVSLNMGIFTVTQTTAHRGFSFAAPENTLYAFEEAINVGADYIELDVQQTKDGQLVVFHDSTLDRTTDGSGLLSDYTYNQICGLSAGSWFDKGDVNFSDAAIPLLSEVLELCGNDIMLNIEIKKSGNAAETARKTVELLMEYDLTDSCYITSFSYPALKEVKKIEPDIKTALISNSASAAVYSQLRYIDAVSLNYIFVNQNIVSSAHKSGKRVFVWTVNNREDMNRMIYLGADNIITDRPDIAAEAVYSYGKGDFVLSLLERLFGA